jgi:bacteriocin-like protein
MKDPFTTLAETELANVTGGLGQRLGGTLRGMAGARQQGGIGRGNLVRGALGGLFPRLAGRGGQAAAQQGGCPGGNCGAQQGGGE